MGKSSRKFENTAGVNFLYREVWGLKSVSELERRLKERLA
jgi:hypothetical protein